MLLAFKLINLGVKIILLNSRGGRTNRYLSIAAAGKKGNIILNK